MAEEDTSVVELVTAFRTGRIDLGEVLQRLASRGALPESEYLEGVQTLTRFREEQALDDITISTLVARLGEMRSAHDDATVVSPCVDAGSAGDMTVVAPRAGGPGGTPGDDEAATRVEPIAPRPANGPHVTGATGSTSAGWERLAEEAGGEVASVGMLLKGRFQLERELGRGGMGVVFLAVDERKIEARDRDPYVAVKVLNDDFRRHPDSLIALQRESRRSQSLAHDNIVRVYDFDKAGTIVFMTMEYIAGDDLRTVIREQAYNGMPLAKARPLIEGMARALGRAHAAGVVHSDFKPGNVMVTGDGVPKVFDFGIARAGKHAASASGEQTVFDASTLGALTPAYASLEMIQGKDPTPSDDIYALGCVCFELLTGKHPFDKLSAEVALREGRKPPAVPGLTKRQYRTLCDAVAFTRERRLARVELLVEGLREVGIRERLKPLVGYGVGAIVLVGAAAWGVSQHMHDRQIAMVIAGFEDGGEGGFADEAQAAAALSGLGEDDRRKLVLDQNELIESFLLRRLEDLWSPAQGRYGFTEAMAVFSLRDDLRLYSPRLDARHEEMQREKFAALNALDAELAGEIAEGRIFGDQPGNALATLDKVRAVDPDSALLHHPGLELAYDDAVADAIGAGELERARRQLAQARQALPDSLRLQLRAGELEVAGLAERERGQAERIALRDVQHAREVLAGRVVSRSTDPGWRDDVTAAMEVLGADGSAQTDELVQALARAIAAEAARVDEPVELAHGRSLVEFGLRHAPDSAPLLAQRERLQAMHAQLQERLAEESIAAEVAARTESVRHAVAASDLERAHDALLRIQALDPDSRFLAEEGPGLLEQAYLEHAAAVFDSGEHRQAAALLEQGTQALGDRAGLRTVHERYALAALVLETGDEPLSEQARAGARERLEAAYRADPVGMAEMEARLRAQGLLSEASLGERIDGLGPAAQVPDARPGGARPSGETASPDSASEQPVDIEDPLPPVPAGPDPCGQPGLVGRGRFCHDTIGETRGPTLVVVPGIGGGKPYALTRAQVTVSEFNRFCADTGTCRVRPVSDPALGALPIENITPTQSRAYARWLVHATGGWRYRLPTEAEWTHAAKAGADWRQAGDSNCIPPTASAAQAGGAPVSGRGREPNPWGLLNLTGNVWEQTTRGEGVVLRGGSFLSYWSECTVDARREGAGPAQRDVGLRLLRELK